MEKRSHFREAQSFASRTLGSPLSESNFSRRDLFCYILCILITFCQFGSICALRLSRSPQLPFILGVLLVQAHTFNVVEVTGHRRFSSVSLTMSTLDYS